MIIKDPAGSRMELGGKCLEIDLIVKIDTKEKKMVCVIIEKKKR